MGSVIALGGLAALAAAQVPLRSHLSIATPALVFVIPVILGVVVGGIAPGVLGSVAGLITYDVFFIPPYGTLAVRQPRDWIALVAYLVVVLVVAQVVTKLQSAQEEAQRRTKDADRLFELSQALIGDLALPDLLSHIVTTVQNAFTPRWTALVLPGPDERDGTETTDLRVAASAGQGLTTGDRRSLTSSEGTTRSLGLIGGEALSRVAVALVASNRPVGLLVLQDVRFERQDRALLATFANQAALAVERVQLREQALRTRLLEEIDRWRGALMGAVSHDLRTPLASVKTAVSTLRQTDAMLGSGDRAELLELIEIQSDRLARLLTNLLDMTRIESGALELRPTFIAFDELIGEVLESLGDLIPHSQVALEVPKDLPLLYIDPVLIGQVLVNLLENSARLTAEGSAIRVCARPTRKGQVEIAVVDDGPGIGNDDRQRVFEMFSQNGGGGRAGLGLAIAKAFVEAHDGAIWIDPEVDHGARIVFTVPSEAGVAAHA
jgi:two-component system sensor histidine kinase KdpD